ncbi:RNA polymerase sigma factor RpoS [Lignipirellula cremea]|uniref:RNA polymerase sigma factor RpoS n=1 Tax=Lignipirellula cremea TaxID=2528010 RepID=A0A518DVZ5_9BACT|nr:RNA polymerase sigma factor RpoS [Lignipirellula cremea]
MPPGRACEAPSGAERSPSHAVDNPPRVEYVPTSAIRPFPSAGQRRQQLLAWERVCRDASTLDAETEKAIFLAMNVYKQRAARWQSTLRRSRAPAAVLAEIEALLADSRRLRDLIARELTPLTAANARMYATQRFPADELASEGSLALLRSIEKFDAARGYRFSTYATHAIRRAFYRYFQTEQRRTSRISPLEQADSLQDYREPPRADGRQDKTDVAIARMVGKLDDRDQLIITSRYGFNLSQKPRTLQSLADELGVCRERVRQLEQRALHKLGKLAVEQGLEPPASISS